MEFAGYSNSETSAEFLEQMGEGREGPSDVIWDNAPVHRGETLQEYVKIPDLNLWLLNLPVYRPDFKAVEAIWGWRERRPPATCTWEPEWQCRNGSAALCLVWSSSLTRRDGAAVEIRGVPADLTPDSRRPANVHTPWIWFSCTTWTTWGPGTLGQK